MYIILFPTHNALNLCGRSSEKKNFERKLLRQVKKMTTH